MTVVNPKSISGINSITTGSGSDNLLTIHTNNGTERLRIDSTGATKIVTGIVTTLSVTGNVDIADTILHTGDTNTKIRFPAADTVTVETGGSEAIRVDSSQNFGVGTNSPTARFDVRRGDTDGKIAEFHQSTGYGIDIGSSQADAYISSGYNQNFIIKTDPTSGQTERLRLKPNGAVGLNSTAPQSAFDVLNQGQTGITDVMLVKNNSAGNSFIRFQDNDGTSNFSLGADDGSGLGANAFILYDRVNSAYRMGIDNSGNMKLHSGNLVIGTSGKGIDFSVTSDASGSSSELLDDYEEGTFTPTYGWSDSAQSGFSASHNYGHYIKIGHVVHIAFWTNFTATPSSSNALQLQLPFTSKNHSGYRGGIPFSFSGITYVGHDEYSQGGRSHINSNTQWMEMGFISHVDGGTWSSSAITPNAMINTSNFQGEGTYIAA